MWSNLVLLKFNEYGIGRLKLTCKYRYFIYIMLKHISFFSWTSLIISTKYATGFIPINDYPDSDLESTF